MGEEKTTTVNDPNQTPQVYHVREVHDTENIREKLDTGVLPHGGATEEVRGLRQPPSLAMVATR